MRKSSAQVFILVGGFVVAGCSSSSPEGSGGGTGGATSAGGTKSSSGGTSMTSSGVGGATSSSGGSVAAGGTGTTTASSATGVGGATSAGGNSSTVGTTSASGGNTGTTGTKAAGGATTGGTKAAGGTAGPGGATSAATRGGSATAGAAQSNGGATSAGGSAATAGTKAAGGSGEPGGTGAGGTCGAPTVNLTGNDAVDGKLITFNENGGWCWYQDERAVVDTTNGKLVVGSVASGSGAGASSGNIDAVIYDIAGGTMKKSTLGNMSVDDHNAPGIVVRPDGKYIAMWAGHHFDCYSNYSIYDGSAWGTKKSFNWTSEGCTWDNDTSHSITYSNIWYLSAEKAYYSGVRSVNTSPNFLTSTDDGATWSYYGRITSTKTVGYVAGYYKYWGNGTDRIDFVGTEAHPRDNNNSLYHGYLKGGVFYGSTGTVVDSTAKDKTGKDISDYTPLLKAGTTVGGVKLSHLWNADLVRYDDGTLAFIGTGRANWTGSDTSTPADADPDKRLFYARFDGTDWKVTYLAKAGPKLYPDEQDYTGLGALDPDDPHTIYISTPIDPRDDTTQLGKREIFRGTTCDNGGKFTWTPVTQKSTQDNIRPIVPKWDSSHTALLWMRGSYVKAQDYSMKIVGVISTK